MMTITGAQQTEIIKLCQAMFNAAPGAVYLGFFSNYMTANNATMIDLANSLAGSSEFTQASFYPTSLTNTEFAERCVTNMAAGAVSNTTHSQAVSAIASMLDAGQTRGEIMLWAADALAGATGNPEWGDAAAQFNNRVAVAQYYSVDRAGSATDLATLQSMTANVTDTAASMAAGMAMVDTVMAGMGMTNSAVAGRRMANPAISGIVQDGYISGATVFADFNGDGIQNPGEPFTITDETGNFILPAGSFGRLIATGGTDIATGLPFIGSFTAPSGSTVVNPLTALEVSMVEQGKTLAEANYTLVTAFGLPATINLAIFDPIAELSGVHTAQARDILAAAVSVNNIFTVVESALTGASTLLDARSVFASVSDALAENISETNGEVSLADYSLLQHVIMDAANNLAPHIANIDTLSSTVATLLADNNQNIIEIARANGSTTDLLDQIMGVATITQGTVAHEVHTMRYFDSTPLTAFSVTIPASISII